MELMLNGVVTHSCNLNIKYQVRHLLLCRDSFCFWRKKWGQ